MKTFNSNKELKQELIKKLQHHQDLDAFIQGAWLDTNSGKVEGDVFKGCFYGCTMQTNQDPIEKFSKKYNIDLWYCYLTERIFEGLPEGEYEKFPLESIKVLPIGVDINKIKSLFHYRVLEDQLQFCKSNEKVKKSILKCMELFKTPFDQIDKSAAREAAESAREAAESARTAESVGAAAEAAAWSTGAAAESAESAAMSAAWSAVSASKVVSSAASAESVVSAARAAARAAAKLAARAAARAAAKLAARAAARAAARSAESAAEYAAWSAELAARSAAWSTQDYYVFMKDTLLTCIKETY